MIYSLEGKTSTTGAGFVVVEVAGVGYQVNVSPKLLISSKPGENIKLYTHHQVREDIQALYGFETEDELGLFNRLISVSGVGPKAGLTIISQLSSEGIASAINKGDVASLASVSGIGKKTAERIILELAGKLKRVGEIDDEVAKGLQSLGFSRDEVHQALEGVDQGLSSDKKLKLALTKLKK